METSLLKKVFRGVLRSLAVAINNLYCIPTYVIWCILLHPLYFLDEALYWQLEGQFFHWLLTMVGFWSYSAGYYIVETGDSLEKIVTEETLLLVNHQSTSDVPILMQAFCARDHLLQTLNWIMDARFQFTNFGVVSTLHGDFFINAGKDRRDASLKSFETYLKTKFLPRKRKWLVLFPEGGFLRKRKEASQRYAAKMNLPHLEHVTLPRLGALQTILNTLGPADTPQGSDNYPPSNSQWSRDNTGKLKYVIDVTVAYANGDPLDIGSVITGSVPSCQVRMHYKIYPINEVPLEDPDKLQNWLYNIYIEKNNMLGHYYRTGVWDPNSAKVDINLLRSETRNDSTLQQPANKSMQILHSPSTGPTDEEKSEIDEDVKEVDKQWVSKSLHNNNGHWSSSATEDEEIPLNEMNPAVVSLKKERMLHLDLLKVFLIHVMFVTSTMLHIRAFYNIIDHIFGTNVL